MRNMKLSLWIVVALIAITGMMSSCIEDGFTTLSSDVLAFNKDTVAFDTVITMQGTATKQMVVYNRSKKQINISSIKVAGLSSKGHFHLNVDGIRGDEFKNVEIRGNDSIYIFIEAYIDELEENEPTLLEDSLKFETNGVSQSVLLTAWGQDVIRLSGDTISRNRRLTADKPYLIYDTVFVSERATLTIDPGATLLFHDKAAMRCAGKMIANGTAEEPITFRGDRLDRIVESTSFDIMSGQWGGIIFTPSAKGNVLKHVVMKGSTIGMHCSGKDINDTTQRALKLVNCVLTNSASTCLAISTCFVEAIGTEFSDAAQEVIWSQGGKLLMSQCTFANNYLFVVPSLPIVSLHDMAFLNGDNSRIKARFNNCILYGLSDEFRVGILKEQNKDDTVYWVDDGVGEGKLDVYMRSCLLKGSEREDGAYFINCVWDADPCFLTVRDDQIFDYRLGNESDAIGKGNPDLCPDEARYDRYGVDRRANGAIDLGAYAWVFVPDEEE